LLHGELRTPRKGPWPRSSGKCRLRSTLLELVEAVSDSAATDTEIVATVVYLVNSGRVQLCGNFRGAWFDLDATGLTRAA